jgi:hypothetical protein
VERELRNVVANLLQTRMLKCTNQQFWIAGSSTGLNAFILTQAGVISEYLSGFAILIACSLVSLIALKFIVKLHTFYYELNRDLVEILGQDETLPKYLRDDEKPWGSINSLLGVTFYSLFVLISLAAVVIGYVTPD